MYILVIAGGYPSPKYKMNGIFEFDQAKALVKLGHKVVFVAIDLRSIRRFRKFGYESFNKDGVFIEALNIPCGRVPKPMLGKLREIALRKTYSKIIKKHGKPDIIHSHFFEIGFASAKVLYNINIPLVHTEHYSGMNQFELTNYYKKIGKYSYNRMDKIIAVSNVLKDSIKDKFDINAIVVPNMVDVSSFQYQNRTKNDDNFRFISVGSLKKNKRMDLLIKAFYNAFKDRNNVSLFIYGDGVERKNLNDLIKRFDLTNRIYLMGLRDREEISNKMQKCDCFVLASKKETFGVAYIEAMSTGLPVITTKCGGPEDFVNEGNGVLIPVDNQEELSRAMQEMYSNIKTYNGEVIAQEIRSKFSSETIAGLLLEIYLELLK